jgi:hypothetical protein
MNRTRCRQRRIAACTVGALHGKEVRRSYEFPRGTMDCPPKWIWCKKGATKIDEKKHGRIQENLVTLPLIMVLNPAKISDSRLDWSHPSTSQLYDSIWGQSPLTKPFTRWCSALMFDGLVSPRELVRYIFHSHPWITDDFTWHCVYQQGLHLVSSQFAKSYLLIFSYHTKRYQMYHTIWGVPNMIWIPKTTNVPIISKFEICWGPSL